MATMKFLYTVKLTVTVETEGGKPDYDQAWDAIRDTLNDEVENLTFDSVVEHPTKDDDIQLAAIDITIHEIELTDDTPMVPLSEAQAAVEREGKLRGGA